MSEVLEAPATLVGEEFFFAIHLRLLVNKIHKVGEEAIVIMAGTVEPMAGNFLNLHMVEAHLSLFMGKCLFHFLIN